jgi:hypothetical protein
MNLAKSSRVLYFDAIDHILRCWFSIQSKVTASTGGVASSDAGGGSPVDVSQVYSVDVGATDDNGGIDIGTTGRGTRSKVAATPVGAEGNGTTISGLGPAKGGAIGGGISRPGDSNGGVT